MISSLFEVGIRPSVVTESQYWQVLLLIQAGFTSPMCRRWAVQKQGSVEGGFMGRTNKLVDGCYSFWQGGLFPMLQSLQDLPATQSLLPFSGVRNCVCALEG